MDDLPAAVQLVDAVAMEAARNLRDRMLAASQAGPHALREQVPFKEVSALLTKCQALLKAEPTLVDVFCISEEVVMVGDTHGHFHDVVSMLALVGEPGDQRIYVFNGDYVDRGAWGLEVVLLLAALKVAAPSRVILLRGNHESSTCTKWYGFKGEVEAKYGSDGKAVYSAAKKLFSLLPLAAVIAGKTLVLHGGLFRDVPHPTEKVPGRAGARKRRRPPPPPPAEGEEGVVGVLHLGTLTTLRLASKGGLDPDGVGSSVVAADVLWSDPVSVPGLCTNHARGVGLTFGPDVTQAFLEANNLSLILRSHEGPDARDRRTDLPQVLGGYSIDHDTPAGKLVTVFSAPDYPQFLPDTEPRYENKGAVVVLRSPDWASPTFVQFEAYKPRPPATAFYDYQIYADTDDELMSEELGSHGSQLSVSVAGSEGGSERGLREGGEGTTTAGAGEGEGDGGQEVASKVAKGEEGAKSGNAVCEGGSAPASDLGGEQEAAAAGSTVVAIGASS